MFTHNHLFNISTRDRPSLQDLNVNPENIDPSRDWEAWTRFRIAVNDRLCENIKQRSALNQSEDFSFSINSYVAEEAPRLSDPRLLMMSYSRDLRNMSTLEDKQFLYYGIPRLDLRAKPRRQWSIKRADTFTRANDRPSYHVLYCRR